MNIFHKVTWESLKKNRTRTLVTIIGIMLSTALLCAVMTSAGSFVHYVKENTLYDSGDWHGKMPAADAALTATVQQQKSVRETAVVQEMGYAVWEGSRREDRPYLYVLGGDSSTPSFLPIHLTEGTYPTTAQEILLPDDLAQDSGVVCQIGDSLTLALGDRLYNGQKMGQADACRLYVEGELQFNGETLDIRETRTYTVAGFYERLGSNFENYDSPGYTAFTWRDPVLAEDGTYDVYFRLHHPEEFAAVMQSGDFPAAEHVKANNDLLVFYGAAPFDNFFKMLYSLVTVLAVLILFGSVSLIYNAFSISVSERTKQFGLLSSIGATKKQLRHAVFFEAFVVSGIGIPLGILVGLEGIGITFLLIGEKFKAMGFSMALRLHVSASSILLTILLALLTVLLSVWIPSRRATKITAIEAIRQNEDIRMKHTSSKTSWLRYKLFGLPGVLAGKHYHRNRKKYRATVVSLFMSVVLFISAFSFTDYLMESVDGGLLKALYDVRGYYDPYVAGNIPETELLQNIKDMETVTEAAVVQERFTELRLDRADLTDKVLKEQNLWTLNTGENQGKPYVEVSAIMTFVDDEAFRILLQENGISGEAAEAYENPEHPLGLLLDGQVVYNEQTHRYETVHFLKRKPSRIRMNSYKAIEGYWCDGTLLEDENGQVFVRYEKDDGRDGSSEEKEYQYVPLEEVQYNPLSIGKMIENRPFFVNNTASLTVIYPMSQRQTVYEEGAFDTFSFEFFIKSGDPRAACTELEEWFRDNRISTGHMYNAAADEENSRNIVTIIRVFAYGFVVLISLIAAANVFNTISTNLHLRRREFAMLQSVGMTKKEFDRMMRYECLLYGTKSLLYGLPASIGVTFFIWKSTGIGFETDFHLPWPAIGIAVGGVFVVVAASMLYAMRKIRKENLLDALRNENI